MNLEDAIRNLVELPRAATMFVPREEEVVGTGTPVMLLSPEDDRPAGWRYLLEVLIAREVLEVWSDWRNGRLPSAEEACEAIAYYADNDAYLPEA